MKGTPSCKNCKHSSPSYKGIHCELKRKKVKQSDCCEKWGKRNENEKGKKQDSVDCVFRKPGGLHALRLRIRVNGTLATVGSAGQRSVPGSVSVCEPGMLDRED